MGPENDTTFEYDEEYEDDMCSKDTVLKVGSIAVPMFYSVVIILSLFGNILVIVILALYENLKSMTNTFILNLALSDLLFTFGLPFKSIYLVQGWTFGESLCKIVCFVFNAGFYSSILFLTLMTVQRYTAVVHPLSDGWEHRHCFTIALCCLAWILSASASIIALVGYKVHEVNDKQFCEYESIKIKLAGFYLQNIVFLISFAIMSYCYICILRTVLRCRSNRRHRTVRLIFSIVAMFFFGWAPYNIVLFLRTLNSFLVFPFTQCHVSNALEYAFFACQVIAFSHCCLNPVFYAFVGIKFRNHLKTILHKLLGNKKNSDCSRTNIRVIHSMGSLY